MKPKFEKPREGQWIGNESNSLSFSVPPNPIIGFIEGDGVGPDLWSASRPVFDAVVEKGVRRRSKDILVKNIRGRGKFQTIWLLFS